MTKTTYKELKILTKHYEFILWAYPVISNIPTKQRFVLGQQLQNSMIEVLKGIVEANALRDKKDALQKVSVELEKTKYLFRLTHDLNFITTKQWLYSGEFLGEIGKMLGGWIRASAGQTVGVGSSPSASNKADGFNPAFNKQEGLG